MYRSSFVFFSFITLIVARPIDLDDNGVPDWCTTDAEGTFRCLSIDGSWKAPPLSTQLPTQAYGARPDPTVEASSPQSALDPARPTLQLPISSPLPHGALPTSGDQFRFEKGTNWTIEHIGDIQFTGDLATKNLVGDKCRSSTLGGKIIWNCGDMMCDPDFTKCGFAMGPAFYGTDNVMTINTDGVEHVQNNDFLQAWAGDSQPEFPQTHWGMDTSNVVSINDTHGVAYARQIWRGAPDGSYADQGNVVASITLGDKMPVANRLGPVLTGPDIVELGLLAILRDQGYIYIYSMGGPSKITVSRVPASDDVFDRTKYESLLYNSNNTWQAGLPGINDTTTYGMVTVEPFNQFSCSVYGSAFFNNYLNKYTIICNTFMSETNMYLSDTPYGPWSTGYNLLSDVYGYGSHAHPQYSPGGSHKVVYFSQGPNRQFEVFKVDFGGYAVV